MEQIETKQTPSIFRLRPTFIPWLPLVLMLVIGALAGFTIVRALPPAEGSPEVTFSRDMAAHHAQAVEMALTIRDRSNDPELRQLAIDIVLTQQEQIGQIQGWLALWNRPFSGLQPPMGGQGLMMGMATQAEVNALRTLPVAKAEVSFLQLMIRHHQGGIEMAQSVLERTKQPEVARLATSIVNSQQGEITYMRTMLAKRGAAPLAPPMKMDHMYG